MKEYTKISIVTPSYNQVQYLEESILSILDQGYPNLEYIIIDGGSTDGSVDIIHKYARHLAYWVSEADKGQYDALNKGFSKATGEIMGWLNADDKYLPWTFKTISKIFSSCLEIHWLTTIFPLTWDSSGDVIGCSKLEGFNSKAFFQGRNLPKGDNFATYFIQQESTFFRRSLWEQTGSNMDQSLMMAGDFELWARFFKHSNLYGVSVPLGGFRKHSTQKTALKMAQYYREAEQVLLIYCHHKPCILKYLPHFLKNRIPLSLFRIIKLAYETKIVQYKSGHEHEKWEIVNKYFV